MVQSLLRLIVLLGQGVIQNYFVTLDQSLGVLLSVFKLLIAISLNSLEQSGESQLLRVAELGFLLLDHRLHLGL